MGSRLPSLCLMITIPAIFVGIAASSSAAVFESLHADAFEECQSSVEGDRNCDHLLPMHLTSLLQQSASVQYGNFLEDFRFETNMFGINAEVRITEVQDLVATIPQIKAKLYTPDDGDSRLHIAFGGPLERPPNVPCTNDDGAVCNECIEPLTFRLPRLGKFGGFYTTVDEQGSVHMDVFSEEVAATGRVPRQVLFVKHSELARIQPLTAARVFPSGEKECRMSQESARIHGITLEPKNAPKVLHKVTLTSAAETPDKGEAKRVAEEVDVGEFLYEYAQAKDYESRLIVLLCDAPSGLGAALKACLDGDYPIECYAHQELYVMHSDDPSGRDAALRGLGRDLIEKASPDTAYIRATVALRVDRVNSKEDQLKSGTVEASNYLEGKLDVDIRFHVRTHFHVRGGAERFGLNVKVHHLDPAKTSSIRCVIRRAYINSREDVADLLSEDHSSRVLWITSPSERTKYSTTASQSAAVVTKSLMGCRHPSRKALKATEEAILTAALFRRAMKSYAGNTVLERRSALEVVQRVLKDKADSREVAESIHGTGKDMDKRKAVDEIHKLLVTSITEGRNLHVTIKEQAHKALKGVRRHVDNMIVPLSGMEPTFLGKDTAAQVVAVLLNLGVHADAYDLVGARCEVNTRPCDLVAGEEDETVDVQVTTHMRETKWSRPFQMLSTTVSAKVKEFLRLQLSLRQKISDLREKPLFDTVFRSLANYLGNNPFSVLGLRATVRRVAGKNTRSETALVPSLVALANGLIVRAARDVGIDVAIGEGVIRPAKTVDALSLPPTIDERNPLEAKGSTGGDLVAKLSDSSDSLSALAEESTKSGGQISEPVHGWSMPDPTRGAWSEWKVSIVQIKDLALDFVSLNRAVVEVGPNTDTVLVKEACHERSLEEYFARRAERGTHEEKFEDEVVPGAIRIRVSDLLIRAQCRAKALKVMWPVELTVVVNVNFDLKPTRGEGDELNYVVKRNVVKVDVTSSFHSGLHIGLVRVGLPDLLKRKVHNFIDNMLKEKISGAINLAATLEKLREENPVFEQLLKELAAFSLDNSAKPPRERTIVRADVYADKLRLGRAQRHEVPEFIGVVQGALDSVCTGKLSHPTLERAHGS